MRQQGVLNRIIALFALFVLVLPASASVVSCLDHAKEQSCCMSHVQALAKKKVAEPVFSCCNHQAMQSSSVRKTAEAKDACHCKIKSAPTKPSNDSVLELSGDKFEVLSPTTQIGLANSESDHRHSQTIFFGDSSPPDDPNGCAHSGRAPPVSVH